MTYHTQYRIWQNSLYSLGRIARRTGMRYTCQLHSFFYAIS